MNLDLSVALERFHELLLHTLRLLPNFLLAAVVLLLTLLAGRSVKSLVRRLTLSRRHGNLALVLGRVAQWSVILVGTLAATTIAFPSFTPANLISALGVTGIAVGFAFRDIFENFLAGILILVTEPFRIGDQIVFGDWEGTVEQIETRASKLRTYDGRLVVIPNSQLFKNAVMVNTAYDRRRLQYDFGIGYGDDIAVAKRLMLDTVRRCDGVLADPAPDALTLELAASSVIIRLRWWIHPPRRADALDATDRVLVAVKQALLAEGIDLPFPIQHVLFHDQTEETDGDRARQREGWPAGRQAVPQQARIADALRQDGGGQAASRRTPTQERDRHASRH